MIELRLDQHSALPLYHQIADQIRHLIAAGQLSPGDHLPTIRELAKSLGVNQNTVVRAYVALEHEQVIVSHRGGGTTVTAKTDDPAMRIIRQRRLSDIVSSDVLKLLSSGYNPEEIEATFYLHIARWREEITTPTEVPEQKYGKTGRKNIIRIVGSHDLALNLLVDLLRQHSDGIKIEVSAAGSLGGLIALQEERAHLAGIHLLDEETGEYNYPYIKRILPGREIAVVNLAYRIQGLMLSAGNPKNIEGLADLQRPEVIFINRQSGSGTRVLLDLQLRQNGMLASEIRGYERELDTHLAVASSIARGEADVGLGIEAAARSCGLDFLPLFREKYDLVIPKGNYESELLAPLLELIVSEDFKKIVDQVGGYDTSQTGMVTFL
jgi:molybdate-binding protein/DNA-binding transcriptional regulator YhcF (GntR family)